MEINGIAHAILTVRDLAISRPFYQALLSHLGLSEIVNSDTYLYYVGGRTAVGLRPAAPAVAEQRFDQGRCGLHHLCFRARSREDVDSVFAVVRQLGATIIHAPEDGPWVPGYYSVLFEDPDGIRLEVNHVPGKGVFDAGVQRREIGSGF
jgi:catechol 2,3-dioxygenase-like lactoylglutathione lyase family enzyme